jgi:hypothetical protein
LPASLVASDASIEAALEPVKLFESICEGCCDVGGRFAIQALCLDLSGTTGGVLEGALEVPSCLGVVVGTLPTGSITSCNR